MARKQDLIVHIESATRADFHRAMGLFIRAPRKVTIRSDRALVIHDHVWFRRVLEQTDCRVIETVAQ